MATAWCLTWITRKTLPAGTDANFVMTGSGGIVEVQGTAEGEPFSQERFLELMALARKGIDELVAMQKAAIA